MSASAKSVYKRYSPPSIVSRVFGWLLYSNIQQVLSEHNFAVGHHDKETVPLKLV